MTILVMLPTDRCNLNCPFCFRKAQEEAHDLPLDSFEYILNECLKYHIDHIGFSGGEFFMHPQWKEFLEVTYNCGIPFSIVSNGVKWQEVRSTVLTMKDKIRYIAFSLDGDRETHDKRRGAASVYDKVMDAIRECYSNGIYTKICFVAGKDNIDKLNWVVNKMLEVGISEIVFSTVLPTPANAHLVLTPIERKNLHKKILDLQKRVAIPLVVGADIICNPGIDMCCNLNGGALQFDPLGNLVGCCELSQYYTSDGRRPEVIGNITNEPIDELVKKYWDWIAALKKKRVEQIRLFENVYDVGSCFNCLTLLGYDVSGVESVCDARARSCLKLADCCL